MVRVFEDDDAGYLDWVRQRPDGYVLNSYRKPSANYLPLHRASCWTITGKPARGDRWTTGDFIKVCADTRPDLEQWARQIAGGTVSPCSWCIPR
jgi:hypothetical protein